MDRIELDTLLEEWADYVRGGRALHTTQDSIMAAIITFKGAPPRLGYRTQVPDLDHDSVPEFIEHQVRQLNSVKSSYAAVLRTEYGLTRFYDSRGQLYRAAKMTIPLRTYKYRLAGARTFIGQSLARFFEKQ